MSIESEVFNRKRADISQLEPYGFKKTKEDYVYETGLLDDQFRAEISVDLQGRLTGRLFDLDTEEEYLPVHTNLSAGGFVGRVREEYRAVLEDICSKCFTKVAFIYDQSNRIAGAIKDKWQVDPEFPWEKYEGNGIFKTAAAGRWFAGIFTVAFGKLEIEDDDNHHHEADEIVEIINLKIAPEDMEEMVKRPGICRGWHMNKKHWISAMLDDRLRDEQLISLVERSHDLVSGAKATDYVRSDSWIIPSNPRVYDIDAGFAREGIIEWHQHNDIRQGDELYIYSAAPNSAIMYRCRVVESNMEYEGMFKESKGYSRAMRLELIEKYPKEKYPLSFMREHGSGPVRSARRMPQKLLEAMKKK